MPLLADLTYDYIKFRCDVDEESECWMYRNEAMGSRKLHPQVHVRNHPAGPRPVLVRRAAYAALHGGDILTNTDENDKGYRYIVRDPRKCQSEGCVNPHHLKAITRRAKVRLSLEAANSDKLKKRIANAKARRRYAKLTMVVVEEIRMLPHKGPDKVTDTEIVRRLSKRGISVCRKAVSEARRGNTWRTYGSVFGGLLPSRGG